MTFAVETKDETETMWLGELLGTLAEQGDVLLLEGELGAGKTTFTKGLAKGLGIENVIKSPTYTLIREYTKGRLPLYHMDVYRLEQAGGDELGLEEYFYGDGVSVIEWSSFIQEELPSEFLKIQLERSGDYLENRTLTFHPKGDRYSQMVKDLRERVTTGQTGGIH